MNGNCGLSWVWLAYLIHLLAGGGGTFTVCNIHHLQVAAMIAIIALANKTIQKWRMKSSLPFPKHIAINPPTAIVTRNKP